MQLNGAYVNLGLDKRSSPPTVTINQRTTSTMSFSWTAVSETTSYDWRYTPAGGFASSWTNVSSSILSATATGLTASTSYLIEVRANVTTGNGFSSSSTSVATGFTKQASLVQGWSGMFSSQDWKEDATTSPASTVIPVAGRTIIFFIPNWYCNHQTPVNSLSVMIGNLTSASISGLKIAYALMSSDAYMTSTSDPNNAVTGDPSTGYAVLPSSATDIPAGPDSIYYDTNWELTTVNEAYKWCTLPFGSTTSAFGVVLRVFIPQFISGKQYACTYEDHTSDTTAVNSTTSILYMIDKATWPILNDSTGTKGITVSWQDGDKIASFDPMNSGNWSWTPGLALGRYWPPYLHQLPILAAAWGTP